MKMIVTGATGQLGGLVMKHLLQRIPASRIVAVARNLDKAASLQESGIEVRYGDYNDSESLRHAFAGGTKLLLVSASDTDDCLRVVQHANAVKAARDAGIRHIAYTSFAFAEDNPFALVHLATEYAIRAARLPYTFLRNGGYSEFFINASLKANIEKGTIITSAGKGRVNAVCRNDLALAAAAVLTGDGHENQTYNLVSDQPWSFDDLAEIVSEVSGQPVVHQSFSSEKAKKVLVESGIPDPHAEAAVFVYNTIAEGTMERSGDDLHKLINKLTPIHELVIKALQ